MTDADNSNTDEDIKSTSIEEAIAKLQEENLLFVDQEGNGHFAVNGSGAKVFPTTSRKFSKYIRKWLSTQLNRRDIGRHTVDLVQQTLDCTAEVDGETIPLNVRLAREDNAQGLPETIYYDLRDGAYAIKITADSWHIVPTPVKFRCFDHLLPQVKPLKTGSRRLECLRPLMPNLKNDDWLLYQVFLVSLFVPNFPRPLLSVDGPNGGGKSSLLKLTADLADPSSISAGLSMIRNAEEIRRLANKYQLLYFDNASRLSFDVSDLLCVLSTGGSSVRRQLYETDSDLIYSNVYRSVLICGIPRVAERADLVERCINLSLSRIESSERHPQSELDSYYKEHKAEILGSIMNILSDALGKVGKTKLKNLPRLADFATLGYSIAESIDGYNGDMFMKAYERMRKRSDQFAIDASPVAQAVQYLLSSTDEWSGRPTEAWQLKIKDEHEITTEEMEIRQEIRSNPYYPKHASAFTKELVRCQAILSAVGIEVECTNNGHTIWKNEGRTINLRRRKQEG